MHEHGECKKCGAVQEFLRAEHHDWNSGDVISIADIAEVRRIRLDDEREE